MKILFRLYCGLWLQGTVIGELNDCMVVSDPDGKQWLVHKEQDTWVKE